MKGLDVRVVSVIDLLDVVGRLMGSVVMSGLECSAWSRRFLVRWMGCSMLRLRCLVVRLVVMLVSSSLFANLRCSLGRLDRTF